MKPIKDLKKDLKGFLREEKTLLDKVVNVLVEMEMTDHISFQDFAQRIIDIIQKREKWESKIEFSTDQKEVWEISFDKMFPNAKLLYDDMKDKYGEVPTERLKRFIRAVRMGAVNQALKALLDELDDYTEPRFYGKLVKRIRELKRKHK
jgi:hypothetical protein